MGVTVLDIRGLSVSYKTQEGDIRALDSVNLHVEEGEIVGLIGETGSGKSTLASTIFGTLPINQAAILGGSAFVDEIDMLGRSERTRLARGRLITLVPQDTYGSLHPLFPIATQMVDMMRSTSPSRSSWKFLRRRRVYEPEILTVLEAVQLENGRQILSKYPHQLSGGQLQRVLLALALLPRPRLIVADEPTSALDATTQIAILRLLRKMASERNTAVLFTTHNLAAAWEICDRIVVMHGGRIVEVAGRDRFFYSPLHPYTRTLLNNANDPFIQNGDIRTDVPGRVTHPNSCIFYGRCVRALPRCAEHMPPLEAHGPRHHAACHNPSTNQAPLHYN